MAEYNSRDSVSANAPKTKPNCQGSTMWPHASLYLCLPVALTSVFYVVSNDVISIWTSIHHHHLITYLQLLLNLRMATGPSGLSSGGLRLKPSQAFMVAGAEGEVFILCLVEHL